MLGYRTQTEYHFRYLLRCFLGKLLLNSIFFIFVLFHYRLLYHRML